MSDVDHPLPPHQSIDDEPDLNNEVTGAALVVSTGFLGATVDVVIDRPLGSEHPSHGFVYPVNYGYVPGVRAPDGHFLDAYVLGVERPLATARGICRGVVHRLYEADDKLVICLDDRDPRDDEIHAALAFQEARGPYVLLRCIAPEPDPHLDEP